jgi:hypothetical protein
MIKTAALLFGVVYALVALLGVISNNTADTWLHVVLAVMMLFPGFGASGSKTTVSFSPQRACGRS